MLEKEIRGFIVKENFQSHIDKFTKMLGQSKLSKRLSLAIADYSKLDLETKVRITNGKTEVVQKVGDFTAVDREEITIKLENQSAEDVLNLFKTYKNFVRDTEKPMLTMIQHENYVFSNDRIEIKLFRQFGNDEFYAFEVEALVEMLDEELENFCEENDLIVDVNYNNLESVQVRNSKVNTELTSIGDQDLLEVIKKYL